MASQELDIDQRLREIERKLNVIGKWAIVVISLSAGLALAGVVEDWAPASPLSWPSVVALIVAAGFVGWVLRSEFFNNRGSGDQM